MYNQTYINDFNSDDYDYSKYLNSQQELIKLKDEYLKQYKDNSNAIILAFKESLAKSGVPMNIILNLIPPFVLLFM